MNILFNIHNYIKESEGNKYNMKYPDSMLNLARNEMKSKRLEEINRNMFSYLSNKSNINDYIEWDKMKRRIKKELHLMSECFDIYSGSDQAIKTILYALSQNVKKISIVSPTYYNYVYYAELFNMEITLLDTSISNNESICDEILRHMENPDNEIIVLTNPNGIFGYMLDINELQLVIDNAYRLNKLVLIDLAYIDFSELTIHQYLKLVKLYNNVILIRTFSKGFATCGLRIAIIYAQKDIISYLDTYNAKNEVSILSIESLIFYYNNNSLKLITNQIIENRNYFYEYFKNCRKVKIYNTHSNFIVVECKNKEDNFRMVRFFLENGIIIRNLDRFNIDNMSRITIPDSDYFTLLLEIFKKYLEVSNE